MKNRSRATRPGRTALLVLGLLPLACGDVSKDVGRAIDPMAPAAVDDHVIVVDKGRAEAVLLDVSGETGAPPRFVPVVAHPAAVEQRRAHSDELLVLSGGQPDDGSATPEQPGLVVIDASGKTREYRYDSAFSSMTQSDDGKYALLFFDPKAPKNPDTILFNPNEIAIVDLDASGRNAAPHVRTLRSFGGAPRSVAFSPEMTVSGEQRRFAIVLFDTDIAIIDLAHLDRSEVTVELSRQGNTSMHLAQVLFSSAERKLYFRATGSNDIFAVSINDASSDATGTARTNDFTASLNQLAAGTGPSDMVLYTEPDEAGAPLERLLVAAPGSSQAVVIEPDSSKVTYVPLPGPASNVLLFVQPKPFDPNPAPRALLYTTGASAVAFLDLPEVESRGARNVELLAVPEQYGSVLRLDDDTVMLLHGGTGLSLLDLSDRTVASIQGPNLLGAVADPVAKKLWLATSNRLGFLDLSTNSVHPNEVRVDAPIEHLVTVPSKRTPRVVVTHQSSTGWATVLDARDPTNLKAAYSERGYLLSDALEEGM